MQVLRDNKESLMAVLEAFVYDPLINWRLAQADVGGRRIGGMYICLELITANTNEHPGAGSDPQRAADLARVTAHPQGPNRKLKANENDIFNGRIFGVRHLFLFH